MIRDLLNTLNDLTFKAEEIHIIVKIHSPYAKYVPDLLNPSPKRQLCPPTPWNRARMNALSNAIKPASLSGESARDTICTLSRLVLFNVKYSPNLGDGLLSECLERELAQALPGCEVRSVDLAGRSCYPSEHRRTRGLALALLEWLPVRLRHFLAWTMLSLAIALRLRRHYERGLEGADAVIVGGGNLLTDADLNFPMKISSALAQANRHGLPVAIYAVGVSSKWSRRGSRIFTQALVQNRPIWASVRDDVSQKAWQAHLAGRGIAPAQLTIDPGVLASCHYPRGPRHPSDRRIGVCITDPLAVRYHSDPAHAANLETWYPVALRSLVEHGFEVILFTNGSPEDREYLHRRLHLWVRQAKGPVVLGRSFDTPADLVTLVSGCDAVVGHRMHACVAAYSFGVPALGLCWDKKLDSFFELTGRSKHMLDTAKIAAEDLGTRTAAAIADSFDPSRLISRAREEVATFAATLKAAVPGNTG
ncbi:MAG: polysaccharide pyruvyl transferase family protein [Novosphingobium sp.]